MNENINLLDYFAAMAATQFLSSSYSIKQEDIPARAYDFAEQMILEKLKRENTK